MKILRFGLAALSAVALSGCVVAPYHPRGSAIGYGSYDDYGEYDRELAQTSLAPPPYYTEARPRAPYAGAVWLGGYWGWHQHRHHWVSGRWDRPRPGYGWAPHRWVGRGGGWVLRGGGWVRH